MRLVSKLSIKWLIGGIILFLGLMLLFLSAQRAYEAVTHEIISRRVVALSTTARELLKLTFAARIERGDNLYALLAEAPIKPATRQTIDERRAQTETDYAASLALLDKLGLPDMAAALTRFRQSYEAMAALRTVVDRAVMLPLGQRDTGLNRQWRQAAETYAAALAVVSAAVDAATALQDPLIDLLLTAKRAAEAGQVHWSNFSTVVSTSIASGKPWGPRDIRQAAENWGQVLGAWDTLAKAVAAPAVHDSFRAAVATAGDALFNKEAAFRQPIIDRLTAGELPGVGIDEWLPHALASSKLFGMAATAALAELVATADTQANASFNKLLVSGGILLLALLSIGGGLVLVSRQVTLPILSLAQVMHRLAERDYAALVPSTERGDELGVMARAVEAFRDNGVRMQRLEAESAERRRSAELEREATEAAEAVVAAQQAAVVEALGRGLEKLANGDLTCRIEQDFAAGYERLRLDFNAAIEGLRSTVSVIAGHTDTIRSGTQEIAAASDDLSRRTERQAAGLEQTAAALQQITATVRRTAEGSQEARDVATTTRDDAERSGQVVHDAVAAMAAIETSARQISQIIGVIDEIAFQTNLLALNAGVEAARAGETGRGFAVVASEVRALAQRSADAAKEIKALIRTSEQHVGRGVVLVGETGQALGRILSQVGTISRVIGEIAASARQQANGLQEINTAIAEMDHVTQQNAAMVEKTTAATHSLSAETEALSRASGQFEIGSQWARRAA